MKNTKKYITLVVLLGVSFVGSPVFAQTASTSTLQALLQSLQAQVADLQAKILVAQQAQTQVTGTLKLISQLKQGATGEDVKLLQTILAADLTVYPEGSITGYFGNLTAQAVKRFQKKMGLSQVGSVGPQTLSKLNDELNKNPVSQETDGNGNKVKCAIVPPGHLIAPGWLRKHADETPIVPTCQTLPPGILNLLNSTSTPAPTSTVDTTSPVISGLSATGITASSAHIVWVTNEAANSKVYYSTVSPVIQASAILTASADLTVNHDLVLSGLTSYTTYYYQVVSADAAGNAMTSGQYSFTTANVVDATPPSIYGVSSGNTTTTSAHVTWSTNESATSKVWYGTSSPVSTAGAANFDLGLLVQNHDAWLTGLAPGTTYYFVAGSADASGNLATSSQYSFATLALLVPPDVTPPIISGVSAGNISSSSANIAWTTNELATSKVWYGTSTPLNTATAPSVTSAGLVSGHSMALTGLNASTTYYYVVLSADSLGNTATSSETSFVTLGL